MMSPKEKEAYSDSVQATMEGTPITITKKRKPRRLLSNLLTVILLLAVVALGYGYYQKQNELKMLKDPAAQAEVARKDAIAVAAQASSIVLLPEGEEVPEVLTINDAELAIKEQPNLAGVVTGDKILLYVTSGKAIVYSPSRNKIVNILPVVLQRPQGQGTTNTQTNTSANTQSSSNGTTSRSANTSANDEE
ncbi:MAG TPA: hypothetical protein VGE62_01260 [Candidatus Paceibacterota bacterium]